MKKILFLVTLPPPMHGSNRVNQMMVENPLLNEQFETHVLALNYVRSIDEIGRFNFLKYVRLVKYLLQLIWLLFTFRPSVVYFVPCVTGGPFWRDCLFVALLKLSRISIILHLHGKGVKNNIGNNLKIAIYKWFFAGAKIILLSPTLYSDIADVVDESQISYLPNGTDIETNNRPTTQQPSDPIRFIFLSNLIPTKGPETLLQACQILATNHYHFVTVYVGNTSRELTKDCFDLKIKDKGLEEYVFFLGPKYEAEKIAELNSADVMVLPTHKDCFPMVLLEAMASGLPIISTFEGAIPDIVDEGVTGFLVPDRDPEKLAEKMAQFINHPDLAMEFGQNCYRKYLYQYSLSAFNQRAAELINEIAFNQEQG